MTEEVCPICTDFDGENLGVSMDILVVFTGKNWENKREARADMHAITEVLGMSGEELQGLFDAYPNPPIVAIFPAKCREAAEAMAAMPGLRIATRDLLEGSDLVRRGGRWTHLYEEAKAATKEILLDAQTAPRR